MDKLRFSHALWMVVWVWFAFASQTIQSAEKPNIIYILADDLGYGDLSCYGQTKFSTPNIDNLASEGITFTQHYSGCTVCAPSRSALLTGQHTGHTHIRGNKFVSPEGQTPLPAETQTFAKLLQNAGYVTGAFGKWGLGYPGSEGDPTNQGFDVFYGYNCQSHAHRYYPTHIWSNLVKIPLLENEDTTDPKIYAQDMIQEATLQFIEDNKNQPFFAFVPLILPHAELKVPNDSIYQKFENAYSERSWSGNDYGSTNFKYNGYCSVEKKHATFASMVYRTDVYVGQIMKKLDELGLTDNTLVIFTSDNGPHTEGGADPSFFDSNGPLKGTKRDLYEGGIRIPFIAKWPGNIAEGTTSDHISAFWDMTPTFLEVAGEEIPEGLDGISMLPSLTNTGTQKEHSFMYWEFHELNGRQAVRIGDWKGVRYSIKSDYDKEISLYNIISDIGETNDVASSHPDIVAQMEFVMQNERTYNSMFNFGLSATTVTSIDLNTLSTETSADLGDKLQLTYTATPTNATDRRVSFEFVTSVSDMNPEISDLGELSVGNFDGILKVIATSVTNPSAVDTLTITVGDPKSTEPDGEIEETPVILATSDEVAVEGNHATIEGQLVQKSSEISQIGFCFSENAEPNIYNDTVLVKPLVDSTFTATVTLNENSTYQVRAFATTASDTVYSNVTSFKTASLEEEETITYDLGDFGIDLSFYLPLDGNTNDVTDNVTPELNGSATYAEGNYHKDFVFDGTGNFIQIPAGMFDPSANDFTLMAWIKPYTNTQDMIIFQQENGDGTGRTLLLASPSKNQFGSYFGGTSQWTSETYTTNTWVHVALKVQPSLNQLTFYINGSEESTLFCNVEYSNGAINIGRHKEGEYDDRNFNGEIDEVMLLNRALSQEEIIDLQNNTFYSSSVVTASNASLENGGGIFPNPISGNILNVNLPESMSDSKVRIQVCSMNGLEVLSETIKTEFSSHQMQLNLNSGAYIVILSDERQRYSYKLVVN